jgi:hypothetical protein
LKNEHILTKHIEAGIAMLYVQWDFEKWKDVAGMACITSRSEVL